MLILASLRTRWSGLISTVAALVLGVALVAAAGLVLAGTVGAPPRPAQRYAHAAAVLLPADELRAGGRGQELMLGRGLPDELAASGVVDRYVYAQLPHGGPGQVGRPWPAAAAGTHRLQAGRAPGGDGEVVVWAGGARPGDRVTVLTEGGAGTYTVSGVLAPARVEQALFFTDREAARLSPRIDALILAAVPAAPPAGTRVVTGRGLRGLDPDAARDADALVAANALVGTAGGIAGFVSVFVVAGTFGYAVAQRRRELALLRAAGATPAQLRRLVLGEALAVGVLAAAVGCLLGRALAPRCAAWLAGRGFAPDWFTVPVTRTPLIWAFVAGVLVAVAGAAAAARRAGRIPAVAALRESAVDDRAMPPVRWFCGAAVLAGAAVTLFGPVLTAPADLLKRKQHIPAVLLLITGCAILAPVLLTVGLAAGLLAITATVERAAAAAPRPPADLVVLPDGTPGLNRAVLDRIRAVPGADVAVTHESALYDLDEGTTLVRRGARTVDPGALPALPVVDGSLARLADDTVVVDQEWGRAAGDEVHVWRADGSPVTLRVAAVVRDGVGGQGAYLTTAHPAAPLAARADVRLRSPATADGLRAAVRGLGAVVVPAGPPPAAAGGPKATGLTVLLGLTLLYAGLSVAGTTVMAARDRRADLELLRLAGATTGQVRRVLAAEAVFVVLVGAVPGLAAAAVALGAQWLALLRLTGEVPALAVPWATVSAVVGAAAAVAAGTAVAAGAGVRRTG